VQLLTLTIKHHRNQNLKPLRQAVAKAWSRMASGGSSIRKTWGIKHYIRALETTHGFENGWHPHLHALLFTDAPLSEDFELDVLERWKMVVTLELGLEAMPDDEHAIKLEECSAGTYITKLGLEVSGITNKECKNGNRTPWQIARAATDGDTAAAALWGHYCKAMFAARQLTWSRGTRDFFGLGDDFDDDLESERGIDATEGVEACVVEWAAPDWDNACKAFPFWLDMVMGAASSPLPLLSLLALPGARLGPKGHIKVPCQRLKPIAWRRSSSKDDDTYAEVARQTKLKVQAEAKAGRDFMASLMRPLGVVQ
jgi:hypothetical protein